jgi:ComF family protein
MFKGPLSHVNRQRHIWLTRAGVYSRQFASAVLWTLAAPRCLLCDAPGMAAGAAPSPVPGDVLDDHNGASPPMDLCQRCYALLPANAPGWQAGIGPIARVCCPWRYDYPVDAMVKALKFSGERAYARLFGSLLAEQLKACGSRAALVLPMPLHRRRLRERGYNQAAEIAQFAAAALRLPLALGVLQRHRATLPQSALSQHARLNNPRGAFVARGALHGIRVALVDDVITTGSTAAAAAEALLLAGVADIELWVLARVSRGDISHSG